MRAQKLLAITLTILFCLTGCTAQEEIINNAPAESNEEQEAPEEISVPEMEADVIQEPFDENTEIETVKDDPVFGNYGRLIFPVDDWYMSGSTLGDLQLTWYNNINPDETVEIVNTLWQRVKAGETVFYDIYTEEEKAEDPAKENTGLFFFRGDSGAKFAICNAGGGFAYVGAMQDSFPHALELSKRGYNAFALIYRPGAQTACEDLARAISFIFEHAEELEVDTDCYSLWGGSAGGRMAAWLGSYGSAAFGGDDLPQPGAVIMQYTGHSDYTESDPPTFACVGESDGIANWRTMQRRLEAMSALGIPTEFHHYSDLPHGFGLGIGTAAEGWLEEAVDFWEAQM
ncbi:MAG: alpha/beta hydrolase [Clostridiales bacterium]|nr:alpha/beta hydrolase [Clostridiales bacterium]